MLEMMCRWASIGALWLLASATAAAAEDVRYPSGGVRLAAELMLPQGPGPHPAVVIAQGSGDSDRSNRWSRDTARIFLDRGLAVLLTDKRGSGASGGNWETASFEELAADTLAGIAYLRTRREIDPARIGMVGLSQSGRYAPLVATMDSHLAFVVSISADAVSYGEQAFHEMANMAREGGMPEPIIAGGIGLARAAARYAINGDWAAYQAVRNDALTQPWAPLAAAFPATAEDPKWHFWRATGRFDPMVYWPIVNPPALIMLGENDEQNNVAVAETVHRLRFGFAQARKTNFTIAVIPGAGHDAGINSTPGQAAATIDRFLRAHRLCACTESD